MLQMATHVPVHMLVIAWSVQKDTKMQSEGRSWCMQYRCKATFGTFYIGYNTSSMHKKPAVYTPTVKLYLINRSHITLHYVFHCLSPEWILETQSAFANILSTSIGGRTHTRTTDKKKIKNTACHIIQTSSGSHTVTYSMSMWVLSQEEGSCSMKLVKNSMYFKAKECLKPYFTPLYVFTVIRAKYLNGRGSCCPMDGCLSQAGL